MIIGHKHTTEALDQYRDVLMVGEHSKWRRRLAVRVAGVFGKADVGISNDNGGEKPPHRKTKGS